MSESLRATKEEDLVRIGQEQALALFESGTAFWGEVLRAQLQIAQSMLTIGWAWALGARPKQLPLNGPRSAALKPPPVAPAARAQRARGRKRGTIRAVKSPPRSLRSLPPKGARQRLRAAGRR